MVSKTQIKNEERDTRKMIVAAKTAKKVAAQKSKKPQGKAIAAAPSGSEAKRRYKPKGAIILKSELAEVASTTPSKDVKKGKDTRKGEGRNSTGKSAAPVAELSGAVEPPFSYEVHHKSKRVLVDVTLHKVPGHLIDVSATTATSLVVQTPKYTKKFSLVFPMPGNLKIDAKSAEYTFENGILKCVLPIAGDIPKELQAQREKLIESFKAQKSLRFRVTKEGDMVVRSRRTVLEKSTKKEEKKGAIATSVSGEKELAVEKKPEATKAAKESVTPKAAKKGETPSPKQQAKLPVAAKKTTDKPQQTQQASKKKFVDDGAAMLSLAKESGNKLRNQLYAKLAQTKQIHQQRVERVSHREVRKSEKKEKEKISFARVIAEQKRQLLEKTAMAAPAPKKPVAGKSVSFA